MLLFKTVIQIEKKNVLLRRAGHFVNMIQEAVNKPLPLPSKNKVEVTNYNRLEKHVVTT